MTRTSRAALLLVLTSALAACASNPNVLQLHKVTAEAIGLGSTDELTMGPVTKGKEDFLGGSRTDLQSHHGQGPRVQLLNLHDTRHPSGSADVLKADLHQVSPHP